MSPCIREILTNLMWKRSTFNRVSDEPHPISPISGAILTSYHRNKTMKGRSYVHS